MDALGWFLASLAVIAVTVLAAIGLAAILTCVGGTSARRAQPRPGSDDATDYDPQWDEVRPGAGPRRGRREAL